MTSARISTRRLAVDREVRAAQLRRARVDADLSARLSARSAVRPETLTVQARAL
jgi:hypothetical protein